jgi:hypothetical protein
MEGEVAMTIKQLTCEKRIEESLAHTMQGFRELTDRMDTGNEAEHEEAQEELWNEPLSIETRITKTIQLSWGGPADQLEYDFDEDRTITEIRYRFMDWGDGAVRVLKDGSDDWVLASRLFSEWVPE